MWRTDLSLGVNLLTQRQNGWFGEGQWTADDPTVAKDIQKQKFLKVSEELAHS